jgi:Spy/CpxP family protein refolding chaperone
MNRKLLVFTFAMSVGLFLAVTAEGQPPPGGGFPGKGGKGVKGGKGFKGGKGADSDRLLDDLNATREQKEKARDALRTYDETVRQTTQKARQELLTQMKDVLSAEDFVTFKAELDQVPLLAVPTPGPRGVPADDLIGRLMGYDTNKDGKITADELPARMHNLIELGDTNGDGALDKEEIQRLSERADRAGPRGGPGGRGKGGPGGGPGGRGKGGPPGQ